MSYFHTKNLSTICHKHWQITTGWSFVENLSALKADVNPLPIKKCSTRPNTPPACNRPHSPNPTPMNIWLLPENILRLSILISSAHWTAFLPTIILESSSILSFLTFSFCIYSTFCSLRGHTAMSELPRNYTISPPYLCIVLLIMSRKRVDCRPSCSLKSCSLMWVPLDSCSSCLNFPLVADWEPPCAIVVGDRS